MFERVISKKRISIKVKKFTDHPVAVCGDPYSDSNVVTQLTHVLPGAPRNHDRNNERGKYHGNTQRAPDHTPADVFKKPEYNVKVFHFAVTQGDSVGFFC